jgi:hypothetical protein
MLAFTQLLNLEGVMASCIFAFTYARRKLGFIACRHAILLDDLAEEEQVIRSNLQFRVSLQARENPHRYVADLDCEMLIRS